MTGPRRTARLAAFVTGLGLVATGFVLPAQASADSSWDGTTKASAAVVIAQHNGAATPLDSPWD